MASSFPFNKDSIWLPDDFEPPADTVWSVEDFLTLSFKLMHKSLECVFDHWKEVKPVLEDDGSVTAAGPENQEQIYKMVKHFEELHEGWREVMTRLMGCCNRNTTAQIVRERMEQVHGIEMEVHEVEVDGHVVGLAVRPKDPDSSIEEIVQYLDDQTRRG